MALIMVYEKLEHNYGYIISLSPLSLLQHITTPLICLEMTITVSSVAIVAILRL